MQSRRRNVISYCRGFGYFDAMTYRLTSLAAILGLCACPALAGIPANVVSGEVLPGWEMQNGHRMAGLSLTLAPQWKTYWRAPGQAGIPPLFDWSGSQNVASVKVHWPSPSVFHTNGLQTVGYHDGVILPLEVVPRDVAKPVHLRARVDMGVCKDICMPFVLDVAADLAAPGVPDGRIKAALKAQPSSGADAGLTAISCVVDPIDDGVRITATMALPKRSGEETVVFEAADPSIWVSEPQTTRQGGLLISVTDMVAGSGQPFALDRSGVTVSVLGAARSVEISGCPAP